MAHATVFTLQPYFFSEKEKPLLEHGELSASIFRYDSGVAALRLKNSVGELIMLPFHGQQAWSANFHGRELTMRSMFDEPRDTKVYLHNYGGFLLHCGMNRMGVPGPEDNHPLHGELPHATFDTAAVVLGSDEGGDYIGLTGTWQHTIAFGTNYIAAPLLKLYAGSSLMHISINVTNLKESEMEYMYMAHVNFRPVDNGRLAYTAPATPEYVGIRKGASHLGSKPGYIEFIEELGRNPEKHHILKPGLHFDPEAVLYINYQADNDGWAHSLQVHPDGNADYIRHRPDQLDKGVRWISRTPDQDALGLNLPATAEPEGYTAEKAKGNIRVLPPKGQFYAELVAGAVSADEAQKIETKINDIVTSVG
jgi:hypothetical protein